MTGLSLGCVEVRRNCFTLNISSTWGVEVQIHPWCILWKELRDSNKLGCNSIETMKYNKKNYERKKASCLSTCKRELCSIIKCLYENNPNHNSLGSVIPVLFSNVWPPFLCIKASGQNQSIYVLYMYICVRHLYSVQLSIVQFHFRLAYALAVMFLTHFHEIFSPIIWMDHPAIALVQIRWRSATCTNRRAITHGYGTVVCTMNVDR